MNILLVLLLVRQVASTFSLYWCSITVSLLLEVENATSACCFVLLKLIKGILFSHIVCFGLQQKVASRHKQSNLKNKNSAKQCQANSILNSTELGKGVGDYSK